MTRTRTLFGLAAALLLVTAACNAGGSSPSASSAASAPAGSAMASAAATPAMTPSGQTVNIGFASVTQPAYAPALIAIATSDQVPMKANFFQQSELAMQALLQGQIDVLAIGVNSPMITINKGADLTIFGVTIGNDWTLVATTDIKTPADLAGKKIAIHSETSTGTPLVKGTLADAGVTAEFVTIPGSPNRAAAMLQGQVDATPLFLSDAISLTQKAPDRFHILLDYGTVPFASQALVANKTWLASHQADATLLLQHFIETARKMKSDQQFTVDQLTKMFPDDDSAYLQSLVKEYEQRGLWVTDGGHALLSTFDQAVKINIDLGTLPKDAKSATSDYVDTSTLDSVLAQLGS